MERSERAERWKVDVRKNKTRNMAARDGAMLGGR